MIVRPSATACPPIQAASTTELRVHGAWADPRVERVERDGAALPAAAASAASAPR
jgi:uncharacterized protein YhdP